MDVVHGSGGKRRRINMAEITGKENENSNNGVNGIHNEMVGWFGGYGPPPCARPNPTQPWLLPWPWPHQIRGKRQDLNYDLPHHPQPTNHIYY